MSMTSWQSFSYRITNAIPVLCFVFLSAAKPRARAAPATGDSVLFEDTSSTAPGLNSQGYYTPGYNMGPASNDMQGGAGVNNLFTDPMANAAVMYGSSLANQGKDIVNKEVRKNRADSVAPSNMTYGSFLFVKRYQV